jgi:hypothetical protein
LIGRLRGNSYLPVATHACRQRIIERLSQRGDGGSGDDDANDDGDTAVRKQKP